MRCPPRDPGFAAHPVHGKDAQERLIRQVLPYVKGRRRAIDVGAHIGTWTTPLAQVFHEVDAFEPERENFLCLASNVRIERIYIHELAVGSQHCRCRIQNLGTNSGCGSVATGRDCLMVTLDSFSWTDVDFIKIDVEGFEGQVLAGATKLLRECKPTVFFEDNGLGPEYYGANWVDPKTVLKEAGYISRLRIQKNEIWCG